MIKDKKCFIEEIKKFLNENYHLIGESLDITYINWLIQEVESLTKENEILRLHGNKDCTAMADERIKELESKNRGSMK